MLYEKNVFKKNIKSIDIHFGLAYPNVYRTAMSSLGYNILYNQINEREDIWCERIIFPNTNSIESNTPSKYFDILSFSIQFEEDYFNVLEMLKTAEIPLKREDRKKMMSLICWRASGCAASLANRSVPVTRLRSCTHRMHRGWMTEKHGLCRHFGIRMRSRRYESMFSALSGEKKQGENDDGENSVLLADERGTSDTYLGEDAAVCTRISGR